MNSLEKSLKGTEILSHIVLRKKLYNYFAEQLYNNNNDKKLFLWAISIILSRGISDTEILSYPFTIVPILDLCNHSNDENARHYYDVKNQTFSLIALKDIDIKTSINISYGKHRECHSFMSIYGFYNNNDVVDKVRLILKNVNGKEMKILIPKSVILIMNSREWNDIAIKLKEKNDVKLMKAIISLFQENFIDLLNKSKELLNNNSLFFSSSDDDIALFILSCIDRSLAEILTNPNENTNQDELIEKLRLELQTFIKDNNNNNNNKNNINNINNNSDNTINWKIQCAMVTLNELKCLLDLKKIVTTYYLALKLFRKYS